jgi:hypothetical protein
MGWGLGSFGRGAGIVVVGGTLGFGSGGLGLGIGLGLGFGLGFRFDFIRLSFIGDNFISVIRAGNILSQKVSNLFLIHGHMGLRFLVQGAEFIHSQRVDIRSSIQDRRSSSIK